jgi:hypothetical protein
MGSREPHNLGGCVMRATLAANACHEHAQQGVGWQDPSRECTRRSFKAASHRRLWKAQTTENAYSYNEDEWEWEDDGADGMADRANNLLPTPLPALGERYKCHDELIWPGEPW